MSDRMRYVLALVVGLLAIPGLAFATSGAMSGDQPKDEAEALGIMAATTAATPSTAISAEDMVRACGVEGRYLVDLESAGAIDDVQQAALNALRPICDEAALPLPAAPPAEGETIVETVTVVRTLPGAASTPAPSATTATTAATAIPGVGAATKGQGDAASAALAVRERALAAINKAIEVGGDVEKINEAIALVDRGDAAYEAGNYAGASEAYTEARDEAIEAQHELQAHEDDEHEDEGHEAREHEDDD